MAYYVLQDGFELCGWKGLPFALRYPNPHFADFFDREDYRLVYWLDGKHDIDQESLTDSQNKLLDRLVERGIAIPSDGMKTLAPWQEYKCYPAMYKNSVQWSITGKCNYKCRHCFMSAPDFKGEDLTMEQVVRILDGLRECGIRSVALTGGEALVHPRFFEILDEIVARNIALETLYTNGELVDARLLDELEKRKLQPAFHLSYDGAGWHDWLRGVDGAEAAVIRAFRLLRERGYQTSVSMCLHRHNIGGLKESIDLLAREGVCHVKMNVASPTGRWKNETEHFISQDAAFKAIEAYLPQYVADGMPVSAQFCGFIDFNREARKILIPFRKYSGVEGADRAFACGAVKNSMYISPTGKILPCMTLGGTAIATATSAWRRWAIASPTTKRAGTVSIAWPVARAAGPAPAGRRARTTSASTRTPATSSRAVGTSAPRRWSSATRTASRPRRRENKRAAQPLWRIQNTQGGWRHVE